MYIYIHIYIRVCMCIYIYIYTYIYIDSYHKMQTMNKMQKTDFAYSRIQYIYIYI